jgi:putative Mg2+ transporter-C (MgtC) family protein
MPTTLGWKEVAIRLGLSLLAGVLIGLNRGEHGRPAGLRTTLLVCLAACVAMIQANLLLITAGKTPASFAIADVMRLPLGILSGMGFIGAGAIVRRDNVVFGITTAATLWFVTVIGLCFGGGQISLGLAALILGLVVLWGLKWVEDATRHEKKATLVLFAEAGEVTESEIIATIVSAGYKATTLAAAHDGQSRKFRYEIKWRARSAENQPPSFINQLSRRPGVMKLEWEIAP